MVGRANTSTSIPDVVLQLQDSKNASKSLVAPERSRATKQTWSRSNTSNDVPQLRRQSLRRPDTSRRPGRGPLQQSTLEPTTLAHLQHSCSLSSVQGSSSSDSPGHRAAPGGRPSAGSEVSTASCGPRSVLSHHLCAPAASVNRPTESTSLANNCTSRRILR